MPDRIGRYQITGELGSGAMGVVYRATDPTIGRTVALKTIRAELVSNTEDYSLQHLAERFRNEARAAGSLNHRNIVTIFDAGEDQGTFFIAMEYLEGTTLQQLIARHRSLPPEQIVDIGTQICAGLDFAHARGIVHRDIKPANIIITTDGTVKITDFGIAKTEAALAATRMTLTGQIVGTPDYMSPEQVKGNPVDGRSDLFALGVVLYQMTTGEKPFPGDSVTTVIYKIVHETPIAPHTLDASVPAGLSAVIIRALAKSPDARFQNAGAMGDALTNYREPPHTGETETLDPVSRNLPPPASDTEATRRTTSGPRRAGRAIVWSAVGLLIAAAAMFLSSQFKRQQQPTAQQQSAPQQRQSASQQQQPAPQRQQQSTSEQQESTSHRQPPPPPQAPPPNPAEPSLSNLPNEIGNLGEQISKATGKEISKVAGGAMPSMVGDLNVTSSPRGATVSVDGQSDGWKTPVHIPSMSIGAHTVMLTKPGYKPASVTAAVTPGNGTGVKASLAPNGSPATSSAKSSSAPHGPETGATTGVVVINSNPEGAKIVLEQYGEGKSTPARLTIPAGMHELVLTKNGYLPVTRSIDVKPNGVTEINADLPRVPGVP